MLKRLISGIVIGLVLGAIAAAAVIKGLHVLAFAGPMLAYVAALATGAVVALVAGKPVWAKGAWIEVGLKAFFGSLLAAGAMFALRKWGVIPLDLSSFGAGPAERIPLGLLPAASLPIIATVLSIFFEIDNTDAPEEQAPSKQGAKPQLRVAASAGAASSKGARVAKDEGDGEEEPAVSKKQRN
jgi:hypothetical protein